MNFKQLTSKLPPEVTERAFQLYYKFLVPTFTDEQLQFERTMDQLIRALEQGIHLG